MYRRVFGLTRRPFEPTTTPEWYFPTPSHDEALASLRYTVTERKGCCLLTGGPGTGKTLVLHAALADCNIGATAHCVATPELRPTELMRVLCAELGLPIDRTDSPAELMARLRTPGRSGPDEPTVVLIDDAHYCDPATLAILGTLAALETDDGSAKCFQVLLAGDDRLRETLARPAAAALRQQLFRACPLKPLSPEQTADYVRHRLAKAGATRPDIFGAAALTAIHQLTAGVPRLINHLCENALISSYADSHRVVKASTLRRIAEEAMLLGAPETPVVTPTQPASPSEDESSVSRHQADGAASPTRPTRPTDDPEAVLCRLERATQDADVLRARLEAVQAECVPLVEAKDHGLRDVTDKIHRLVATSNSLRKTFRHMVAALRQAKKQIETIESATQMNAATIQELSELRQWINGAFVAVRATGPAPVTPSPFPSPSRLVPDSPGALDVRRGKARLALDRCSRVLEMLQTSPDLFTKPLAVRPRSTAARPTSSTLAGGISQSEVDHFTTLVDEARSKLDVELMPAEA